MIFKGVSRVFQVSFKKTFKVFQKKFHVAWHSSQLPEQKEGWFFQNEFLTGIFIVLTLGKSVMELF